jgi:hypothetical protein
MKKFRLIPYHHEENHFEIVEELIFEHEYAFETTDPTSVLTTSQDFGLNDVIDSSGNLVQKAVKPEPTPEDFVAEIPSETSSSESIESVFTREKIQQELQKCQWTLEKFPPKIEQLKNNQEPTYMPDEIKSFSKEEKIAWYEEKIKDAQVLVTLLNEKLEKLN